MYYVSSLVFPLGSNPKSSSFATYKIMIKGVIVKYHKFQNTWGKQSSQESLLEVVVSLICIEAENALPNLPSKWQLN